MSLRNELAEEDMAEGQQVEGEGDYHDDVRDPSGLVPDRQREPALRTPRSQVR